MTSNHLPLDDKSPIHRVDIDTIATDSGFSETAFDGIGFGLGWSLMGSLGASREAALAIDDAGTQQGSKQVSTQS